MNDKDKEAYEKYLVENNVNQRQIWNELSLDEIWQAACEYKQKEIDELEKEKDYLCKKMENMREIYKNSEKLQVENSKLRECVEFYAQPWERGELDGELLVRKSESYDHFTEVHYKARQCLKELDEKL